MHINIIVFLYHLMRFWSLSQAVDYIKKKYHNDGVDDINDLDTNIFGITIYIISSKDNVKDVLSREENSKLTFINETFMVSHGHKFGIGGLQSGTELWNHVHKNLAKAIDLKKLEDIIDENANILTHKYNFTYGNVNDVVSEFVMKVWCQFCFDTDSEDDFKKYSSMRNKLIATVRETFYYRKTNYIPVIGTLLAKFYCWIYKNEFNSVDKVLIDFINNNKTDGFIHKFKHYMHLSIDDETLVNQVVLDNAFLSVLVYDFLHVMTLNSIMAFAEKNVSSYDDRINMEKENIRKSFLFPNRIRKLSNGDYAIINLIDADYLFSYGPRVCIGHAFTSRFYKKICKIFEHFDIVKTDNNVIKMSDNKNVPLIVSQHSIELRMSKSKAKDVIQSFPHKGIEKFYRIESITEDINLYKYICCQMYRYIQQLDKKIHYIVVSEARGFLFTPIAYVSGIPIITVRKQGKLSGEVESESYKKSYDSTETIEMSKFSPVKDKNVVIIDDGFASGATTDAIHKLINKMGGTVCGVVVAVRHSYVHSDYENKYNIKVQNVFDL